MQVDAQAREQERLAALNRYDVLDTPSEEAFDRVTRLTRRVFEVPMSTVSLIDGHRQWFKSRQGVAACETARGPALCNVAIQETRPLIVPDTLADVRFAQSPFVTDDPHIRFYAGAPLRTPEGHTIGTLCAMDTKPRSFDAGQVAVLIDLAHIVMSELGLRLLATTDGLTGILTRRAFRDEASRTIAPAQRHRYNLSCIVFDLDHFKAVNDRNGHAVGDLVLTQTAATCQANLRKSDLFGRIGGEEFAVLLPHTDRRSALQVAEKLRLALADLRVPTPSGTLAVTASFGVASLGGSVSDTDALLQGADEALYAAKADGRNRCKTWQPVEVAQPDARRRVLKAGRISFNGGHSSIDCTVRSLSESSAGFDVINSAGVPDQFKLQVESDDLYRLCRVVTNTDRHLEVAFV
ncbi:hypothetical protein OPKNFCMD_6874 [Methylobacterium crusticola]|uniref:diguanylate cyclase n=1 Tax=Methylobacterium crusticola TaxID=1697972 RepID=A0ABQ4R8T6_9HYPH|nr:sensor domain-containing diguanylate cyclase [Methylobacterium crusticola]GJD54093.1 hypothetical protein OPKNFCMD_6874 [Methylobacterium crusticola]